MPRITLRLTFLVGMEGSLWDFPRYALLPCSVFSCVNLEFSLFNTWNRRDTYENYFSCCPCDNKYNILAVLDLFQHSGFHDTDELSCLLFFGF